MPTDQVNANREVREWLDGLTVKCPGIVRYGELASVEVTINLSVSLAEDLPSMATIRVKGGQITKEAYSGLWATNGVETVQMEYDGAIFMLLRKVLLPMPDIRLSFAAPA